jgi:hypothetical protein
VSPAAKAFAYIFKMIEGSLGTTTQKGQSESAVANRHVELTNSELELGKDVPGGPKITVLKNSNKDEEVRR